jgi:hypothetical protein
LHFLGVSGQAVFTEDGGHVQTNTTDETRGMRTVAPPQQASSQRHGTYVAETYAGDISQTMGGSPALARDGEPAGLARVTLAMRPARKESPAPRRLVGLCSWAAAIGILGLFMAIRAAVAVMLGTPSWYVPAVSIIAVAGVAATMGAFLAARARVLPWVLLGAATTSLAVSLVLTSFASN